MGESSESKRSVVTAMLLSEDRKCSLVIRGVRRDEFLHVGMADVAPGNGRNIVTSITV